MKEYFFGIDLGGTNTGACLIDSHGHVVARESQPSQIELGPVSLTERLTDTCKNLAQKAKLAADSIKAVGIGSPGPLSKQGKIIKAGNLPGFDNFPLRAEFSNRLQLPAVLDNDANVACWGEFWLGAGKHNTDMALLTLGTGIGGGLVCAGELVHGSDDNAAELGHMIIQPGGRLCSCGQHGCLESHASASHTAARAAEALDQGRTSRMQQTLRENGSLTCKDVFDHAKDGDELAMEVVDGTARALAQACVNLRHITEPQRVVFSGGMINAGDFLLDRIQRFYQDMMWTIKTESMEICLAQLGSEAGVIGAAGLALHAWQQGTLCPVGT